MSKYVQRKSWHDCIFILKDYCGGEVEKLKGSKIKYKQKLGSYWYSLRKIRQGLKLDGNRMGKKGLDRLKTSYEGRINKASGSLPASFTKIKMQWAIFRIITIIANIYWSFTMC